MIDAILNNPILLSVITGLIGYIVIRILEFLFTKYGLGLYYRSFCGIYKHASGKVIITHSFGIKFRTKGIENSGEIWEGEFVLKTPKGKNGSGWYEWEGRKADWGFHYIQFLGNGDISVNWINKSAGKDKTGALIWEKIKNTDVK